MNHQILSQLTDPTSKKSQSFENIFASTICRITDYKLIKAKAAYILVIIFVIQTFSLIIDTERDAFINRLTNFTHDNEDPFILEIVRITQYFNIYPIISDSENGFLALFYIVGLLVLLYTTILVLLFAHEAKNLTYLRGRAQFIGRSVVSYIFEIYQYVLVLPIHLIVIQAFLYEENPAGGPDVHRIIKTLESGSIESIIHMVFGGLFMACNLVIGILSSFYSNFTIALSHPMCRLSTFRARMILFARILLGSYIQARFADGQFATDLRVYIVIGLMTIYVITEFLAPEFPNRAMSKLFCFGIVFIYFSEIMVAIIMEQSKSDSKLQNDIFLIFYIIFIPFLIKVSSMTVDQRFQKVLVTEALAAKTQYTVILKYMLYLQLLNFEFLEHNQHTHRRTSKENELILKGVISNHMQNCQNIDCICYRRNKLYDFHIDRFSDEDNEPHKDLPFLIHFGLQILSDGRKAFKKSSLIPLHYANYLVHTLKFVHQGYIVIQTMASKLQSLNDHILLLRVTNKVKGILHDRYDEQNAIHGNRMKGYSFKRLDTKALLTYEKNTSLLVSLVRESIQNSLEIWNHVREKEVRLDKLNEKYLELRKIHDKILKNWKDFENIKSKSQAFFYLVFGFYMLTIRNDPKEGEKLLKEAFSKHFGSLYDHKKTKNDDITEENLYDKDTIILCISAEKEKLGRILDVNRNSEYTFGATPRELIGKKIDTCMTDIFSKDHDSYMQGYLETGKEVILSQLRTIFAKHKEGYIFPTFIYVKMNPDISHGISYVGMLKPQSTFDYHIICDAAGTIDSMSKNMLNELELSPDIFNHRKISMKYFCPELEEVLRAFNYYSYKTYGGKIFEDEKYHQSRSPSIKKIDSGAKIAKANLSDTLTNADFYDSLDSEDLNLYQTYFDAFSAFQGGEVFIRVPSSIRKFNEELKNRKQKGAKSGLIGGLVGNSSNLIRLGTFSSNAQSVMAQKNDSHFVEKELRFACQISDLVFKGKDLIRVITLKLRNIDHGNKIDADTPGLSAMNRAMSDQLSNHSPRKILGKLKKKVTLLISPVAKFVLRAGAKHEEEKEEEQFHPSKFKPISVVNRISSQPKKQTHSQPQMTFLNLNGEGDSSNHEDENFDDEAFQQLAFGPKGKSEQYFENNALTIAKPDLTFEKNPSIETRSIKFKKGQPINTDRNEAMMANEQKHSSRDSKYQSDELTFDDRTEKVLRGIINKVGRFGKKGQADIPQYDETCLSPSRIKEFHHKKVHENDTTIMGGGGLDTSQDFLRKDFSILNDSRAGIRDHSNHYPAKDLNDSMAIDRSVIKDESLYIDPKEIDPEIIHVKRKDQYQLNDTSTFNANTSNFQNTFDNSRAVLIRSRTAGDDDKNKKKKMSSLLISDEDQQQEKSRRSSILINDEDDDGVEMPLEELPKIIKEGNVMRKIGGRKHSELTISSGSNDFHNRDIMLQLAKHIDDDSSEHSSTHSNTFHTFMRSYGVAIDEEFYSKTFKGFSRLLYFMILLIYILALSVFLVNYNSINSIESNINVGSLSARRNNILLTTLRRIRNIDLLAHDMIADNRFRAFDIGSYFDHNHKLLLEAINEYQVLTSELLLLMESLPGDYRELSFDANVAVEKQDPVTGETFTVLVNSFVAESEIMAYASEIYQYTIEEVREDKNEVLSKIAFLEQFLANDLLISAENNREMLLEELDDIVAKAEITSITMSIIVLVLILFSFISYFPTSKKLKNEYTNYLRMLLVIDEKDVVSITTLLIGFQKIIEDLNQTAETLMFNFNQIKKRVNLFRDTGMRKKKFHKTVTAGSLQNHYLTMQSLKISIIYAVAICLFTLTLIEFLDYIEKERLLTDQIRATQDYLMDQNYVFDGIRELISTNSTAKMLQTPIDPFVSGKIEEISNIFDYSNQFLDESEKLDPNIDAIFSGDLCQYVPDEELALFCKVIAKGVATDGLLQYYSYFYRVTQRMYDEYKVFQYTEYDTKSMLDQEEYVELEHSFRSMVKYSQFELEEYLKREFSELNDIEKTHATNLTVGFFVAESLLILVLLVPTVQNEMKKQQLQKQIFRLIPFEVVLKNSYLKHQLKYISRKTLATIKM